MNPRIRCGGLQPDPRLAVSLDMARLSRNAAPLECIGTSGCDASPDRYGGSLNKARGLTQCEPHQTAP